MAKESRIKIDLLRLHDSDPLETEIRDYLINEVSSARRQEAIRTLLKAGYALLTKGQLPATTPAPTTPVNQPFAQPQAEPTTPALKPATPAPEQEVDQSPPSSSLDHQEEEAPKTNNSTESDSMDAADPLSKMKAKIGG